MQNSKSAIVPPLIVGVEFQVLKQPESRGLFKGDGKSPDCLRVALQVALPGSDKKLTMWVMMVLSGWD